MPKKYVKPNRYAKKSTTYIATKAQRRSTFDPALMPTQFQLIS